MPLKLVAVTLKGNAIRRDLICWLKKPLSKQDEKAIEPYISAKFYKWEDEPKD